MSQDPASAQGLDCYRRSFSTGIVADRLFTAIFSLPLPLRRALKERSLGDKLFTNRIMRRLIRAVPKKMSDSRH
jgi:hypothetical protein